MAEGTGQSRGQPATVAVVPAEKTAASDRAASRELMASPTWDGHPRKSWLERARRGILQGAVIAVLLALAYVGHRSGWRFGLVVPESHSLPAPSSRSEFQVVIEPSESSAKAFCEVHQIYGCPVDHRGEKQSLISSSDQTHGLTSENHVAAESATVPPPIWLGAQVRITSPTAFATQAFSVGEVVRGPFRETARGYGKLTFFPADQAELKALLPGIVRKLTKRLYERVEGSEVIAVLDSPGVIDLKTEYVRAWVELAAAQRKLSNLLQAPVPDQDKQLARAAVEAATIAVQRSAKALLAYGFPPFEVPQELNHWEDVMEFLRPLGWTSTTGENRESWLYSFLPIRAPFDGVITELPVSEGQIVEQNQVICRIVNPSRLLLVVFLPGEVATKVKPGLAADVKVEGSHESVSGRVIWIGPTSDSATVQVPVHIEIDNASEHLRAGALAEAEIILRETQQAVLVPEKAVHGRNDQWCVFVLEKGDPADPGGAQFSARMVRVAGPKDGKFEVLAGLLPGERVAVDGSELMWDAVQKATRMSATAVERISTRPLDR